MKQHYLRQIRLENAKNAPLLQSERDLALKTLAEDSVFEPVQSPPSGPYDLTLSIQDGRLVMDMTSADGTALPTLVLSVKPYSRLIRDYFMMIESYETMRRSGDLVRLEAIDMGRRGLHDEGAALLMERLADRIRMDHATARRLFTLICVLHSQNCSAF